MQRGHPAIVEGTTARYGFVRTDHTFIAAGAFFMSLPSDLIQLQGRFLIRVELKSLSVEDFIRILRKEPKERLAKQYTALLETEGIKLVLDRHAGRGGASRRRATRPDRRARRSTPATWKRAGCSPVQT